MKIALEEHFLTKELLDYCANAIPKLSPTGQDKLIKELNDIDDLRLPSMNQAGIDFAVLSISGPGVQAEKNTALAIQRARGANDDLAKIILKHPTRFGGFAHLPMQNPVEAANELERCINDLGFVGSMVHGHTNGVYLDHPQYDVFWERMQALDVPLYLHPNDSFVKPYVLEGCDELLKCTWEWNFETASHFLRLIYAGVFDRFPKLNIILGHMGEMLPFELWRLDSRTAALGHIRPLKLRPSEYLKKNLYITTSAQCDDAALLCSLMSLGDDHVLFSVDYPYERNEFASAWIDIANVTQETHAKICYLNAQSIMKLPKVIG